MGHFKAFGMQWGLTHIISLAVLLPTAAFFIHPRVRRLNQYTTGDLLRIRYGRGDHLIAALLVIIGEFAIFTSATASFVTMVNGYLGVPCAAAMVIAIAVFSLTAMFGGLRGVAWGNIMDKPIYSMVLLQKRSTSLKTIGTASCTIIFF
jgi:Na+/proline symporter